MAPQAPDPAPGPRPRAFRSTEGLAALACGLVPSLVLRDALFPDLAPGRSGEALYSALWTGGQVRRWLLGDAPPGTADLVLGSPPFWPARPLPALFQAAASIVVGDGPAHGLLLLVGLWCAGWGAWRLGRHVLPGRIAGPLIATLAVQVAPPVVGSAWSGDLAVLALGPWALALAATGWAGRAGWGFAAGAWSPPLGVLAALVSLVRGGPRRARIAGCAALLPLLVGLAFPPGDLPGHARGAPAPPLAAALVTADGAVLPGPTAAPPPVAAEPAGGPWGRATTLLARVQGGPAVIGGCLLALALGGTRRWGGAGLATIAGLTALAGFLPGVPDPAPLLAAARVWVPGLVDITVDGLVPAILAAGLGFGAVTARAWPVGAMAGAFLVVGSPIRSPAVPVSDLSPDPAVRALADLPPGPVLHLPDPAPPLRQPGRPLAQVLHLASRHGRPVHAGASVLPDPAAAILVASRAELTVDLAAAPDLGQGEGELPFARARGAGFVALIEDTGAIPEGARAMVEADLEALLGPPLDTGRTWTVWTLGPAGPRSR